MISYHSNYFQVVINMSQVPIELYPPKREWGGGGADPPFIILFRPTDESQ